MNTWAVVQFGEKALYSVDLFRSRGEAVDFAVKEAEGSGLIGTPGRTEAEVRTRLEEYGKYLDGNVVVEVVACKTP